MKEACIKQRRRLSISDFNKGGANGLASLTCAESMQAFKKHGIMKA